ncbi:MAG: c-type cytochrome [Myxococcota bacterium]
MRFVASILCFWALAPSAVWAEGSGTIRGRVIYEAEVPPRPTTEADVNPDVCGAHGPISAEDLVVSRDHGLSNVVLILAGITERKPPKSDAHLEQKGCVFSPHVQAVTVGSELLIGNDDPVVHNVHGRINGETVFNLGMPIKGVRIKRKLKLPGLTTLRCDSGHTWMLSYIAVVPHSYHAVSDASGEFVISGVAPGAYTVRAWHERLGVIDVPVILTAGKDAEIRVEFPKDRPLLREPLPLSFALEAPPPPPRVASPSPGESPAPSPSPSATPEPSPAIAAPLSSGDDILAASEGERELSARRAEREADIARGRASYLRHCAACHGDLGDGRGESISFLRGRPRDFTRGTLEFRSTRSGDVALEEDIVRTIAVGIPGTEMRSFRRQLSPAEQHVLARYVMSFSDRYLAASPVQVPGAPETPKNEASIARGKELWTKLKCAQCHGPQGRADGLSKKLVNDWGEPIKAADLGRGIYKSGPGSRDIYRTLMTGLNGTPMPAFSDLITPEETWDLVHYVESLAGSRNILERIFVPVRD